MQIAACGFWKPIIEDPGMNYFTGIIANFHQHLPKQTLRLLSSSDSFGFCCSSLK